ncbi:MAG: LysR family transcriptional regulator [Desulfobacterales bacterium]|nr:LysR family transcriptional regulator [Desulfobacterales bacterium]
MIYNPDLDINQLRAFVTVAELKSFTRAALRLNRTQSAVSMQVRRLEQNMGRSLLTRTKGGVGLTESGRVMLEYARRILKLNDEVMAEIGDPEVKGRVRLGIPDDYAAYLLPGALSGFGSLYPGISLEVYCELSVDLLQLVEDGEVDLAVTTRQPQSPGGTLIRKEQMVWAEAAGYRLHEEDPLPLALFPDGVCVFRESALKTLRSCGRGWRIVCTSRGLAGIRAVVTSAMAITVVTENTVSPNMQIIEPEAGLPALPQVDICLHVSRSPVNEAVTVFADYISRSLKNC